MDHTQLSFYFKGVVSPLSRTFFNIIANYSSLLMMKLEMLLVSHKIRASCQSALNKNVLPAFQTLQNWPKMTFEKLREKFPCLHLYLL